MALNFSGHTQVNKLEDKRFEAYDGEKRVVVIVDWSTLDELGEAAVLDRAVEKYDALGCPDGSIWIVRADFVS